MRSGRGRLGPPRPSSPNRRRPAIRLELRAGRIAGTPLLSGSACLSTYVTPRPMMQHPVWGEARADHLTVRGAPRTQRNVSNPSRLLHPLPLNEGPPSLPVGHCPHRNPRTNPGIPSHQLKILMVCETGTVRPCAGADSRGSACNAWRVRAYVQLPRVRDPVLGMRVGHGRASVGDGHVDASRMLFPGVAFRGRPRPRPTGPGQLRLPMPPWRAGCSG